jgi:hypothetical protein
VESWICSQCGKIHTEVPDSYGFDAPWPWFTFPETERSARCTLTKEYCTVDEKDFFIQGCLEIPVLDRDDPFIWGVWVSLSRSNFERARNLAQDPKRAGEPAYFGWLSSRIQLYPDTLLLKTHVHTRQVGIRPYVELEPTDHPLAIEQRAGITKDRIREIAELTEHRWLHPKWDSKEHE